jgi:hypothetical protein
MVTPRNVLISVVGILVLSSLMKTVVPEPYLMIKQVDAALQTALEKMYAPRQACVPDALSIDC